MSKKDTSDAIALLTHDHKKILALFDDFRRIKEDDDADDAKQALVERACMELSIHRQVEEELFYPLLNDELDDTKLLDQAAVEHEIAGQLIADLESMQAGDDFYDAKFIVLGEYIRHHIEEEQEKIFPRAKKSTMDLKAIGEDILHRRDELRTELGGPEVEESHPAAREAGNNGSKRSGRHA